MSVGRGRHHAVPAIPTAYEALAKPYGVRVFPTDDGEIPLFQQLEFRAVVEPASTACGACGRSWRSCAVPGCGWSRFCGTWLPPRRRGADLVVHQPTSPGHHVAELLGVPGLWLACNAMSSPTVGWPPAPSS